MRHHTTSHVTLQTNRCIACYKCVEACPKGVLDKMNILFHKHAHVKQPDSCIGCLKCVKTCENKAIVARGEKVTSGAVAR